MRGSMSARSLKYFDSDAISDKNHPTSDAAHPVFLTLCPRRRRPLLSLLKTSFYAGVASAEDWSSGADNHHDRARIPRAS